jgi:uncharacterized protein YkwD
MKWSAFVVLALVLLVAPRALHPSLVQAQGANSACADAEESAFLQLINDYRVQNGLQPLALSQALSVAADQHSQDMATNEYVGYVGTDGWTVVERSGAAGYPDPGTTMENVFAGDPTAAGTMSWWQNSPVHNAIMLDPSATAIGIARVNNADSLFKWYWTTTFGATVEVAACIEENSASQEATTTSIPAENACADPEELALLALINDYRAQNGLAPLVLGPALTAAADAHSQDMATNNFAGDIGSDGLGWLERATEAGYPAPESSARVWFVGNESAASAFDFWKNSPAQNESLLDPSFVAVGIARANNPESEFQWYWTTTFGPVAEATSCDATAVDSDGDGLTDSDETTFYGTDLSLFDTDGDGAMDGDEVSAGTDPLDPNN